VLFRRLMTKPPRPWIADLPGLVRIVPSHGPVLEADPAGVLRRAAEAIRS